LFINNEFVNSVSGKTFATFNPCNGEKIADVQEGDKVPTVCFIRSLSWSDLHEFNLKLLLKGLVTSRCFIVVGCHVGLGSQLVEWSPCHAE